MAGKKKSVNEVDNSTMMKEWEKALKGVGEKLEFMPDDSKDVVPSGFDQLDNGILQSGGFPLGKISQLEGKEGSGKSLILLRSLAKAQKKYPNKMVGYIDTEFNTSKEWAEKNGIDWSRLLYFDSNIMEECYKKALNWANSNVVSLIGVDSLGNMQPASKAFAFSGNKDKFDLKKNGDRVVSVQPGVDAKVTTDATKDLALALHESRTGLIVVNQQRDIIGASMYGPKTTTPGGRLWKFDLCINAEVFSGKTMFEDDDYKKPKIGHSCKVKVDRNKFTGAIGTLDDDERLEFYLEGGEEISLIRNIKRDAVAKGVILISGASITLLDANTGEMISKWRGKKALDADLLENEDLRNQIVKLTLEAPDEITEDFTGTDESDSDLSEETLDGAEE